MSDDRPLPAAKADDETGLSPGLDRDLCNLQVRLAADGIRDISLSSPVWALIMTFLFGGIFPELGDRANFPTWPWVTLCAGTGILVLGLWRYVTVKSETEAPNGPRQMHLISAGYFAAAASWSLIIPIFWQPDNALNHCFLLVITMGAVSLYVTSRSGNFMPLIAATAPNLIMIYLHFLQGELAFDTLMLFVLPIWAIQLHVDSWRGLTNTRKAHRRKLAMERLAADLAVARDQAAEASKAKSVFLANMSHELRTPLNAIMAFSEIIATEALGRDAQDRYRKYAGDVLHSGQHLLGLVNDLLDLAKIESGKVVLAPEYLDGDEMLHECMSLLETEATKRNITLNAECNPSGLQVYADDRGFRQIAINLLSNAVKFTPAGGRVEISLKEEEGGVMLRVVDTGKGMPTDQIERLLQPFEQLDNRYGRATGGTGLGLALVRALTSLHGGRFEIESEVGTGTTIRIWFPSDGAQSRSASDACELAA